MAMNKYMNNDKNDIRYVIHYLYIEYNIKKHLSNHNHCKNNYIIAACAIKNFIEINNYRRKKVKITKNLLINLFNYVKFAFNYQTYTFLRDQIYNLSKICKKSNYYLN